MLRSGLRVGVYLAMPTELPLDDVITLLRRRGCLIFVPQITRRRHSRMVFHALQANSRLAADRWQIPQLHSSDALGPPIDALQLDLVLVPMLGFDAQGHRLGMGAGYYDRYFARLRGARHWRKPRLIGVAYDIQRVETLPTQSHDVAMDFILTESGLHRSVHP